MDELWKPSASLSCLKKRAAIISKIRSFFERRGVLEVETPLLSKGTVTDPHVVGIPAHYRALGDTKDEVHYLQTSPEYAMKRLLAAGSGPIFQITKAFRQGEMGRKHNPEFTMLEWYRPEFDHHALMDEMDDLLMEVLQTPSSERISYCDLFLRNVNVHPIFSTEIELVKTLEKNHVEVNETIQDRNTLLDLVLTHCIEPVLGMDRPAFIYDFPASQAALAKIRNEETPPVASRFEVYFKGIELANGFHELQDASEQAKRFEKDLAYRQLHALPTLPMDERFLNALKAGLPDCAGVALGVDRLVMLALACESVHEVVSFAFDRA